MLDAGCMAASQQSAASWPAGQTQRLTGLCVQFSFAIVQSLSASLASKDVSDVFRIASPASKDVSDPPAGDLSSMGILDDVEFTKPFLFCMISC
jgi:hypothetical protein